MFPSPPTLNRHPLHRGPAAALMIALCLVTFGLAAACASEDSPASSERAPAIPAAEVETPSVSSVGSSVGDLVPEFEMLLIDGNSVTSAGLKNTGKPVFLFFFATWCPVCRSELRRMKDIYPEFSDKVDFYMVGQDLTETLEEMEQYRVRQGYTWPAAQPPRSMLIDLKVLQQSTKLAIDSEGLITYRDGYRKGSDITWRKVLQELASND